MAVVSVKGLTSKRLLALLFALFLLFGACSDAQKRTSHGSAGQTASEQSGLKKGDSGNKYSALLENEQLYSVGENEIDLFWQTSEPTLTSVSYGENSNSLKTKSKKDSQKNHYLRIGNLKPKTTYYYRINGVRDSELERLKTLAEPGGKYLFSFAVCTDTHLSKTKLDEFGGLYRESWDIFNSLVDEVNEEKVDFLVIKGDVSLRSEAADYQALAETAKRLNCKVYVVPGNHDKLQTSWGLFFGSFSPSSSPYFSINNKNWHFVFLDSATEDQDKGYLGPNQLSWLETDLNANANLRTMVFMHHLVRQIVFPKADRFFIQDTAEFLKLIASYPVIAVHSGHAHLNKLSTYKDTDLIITAAVVNYPIQYNVYHVYEKGYVQVSHRVQSCLDLGEASKEAMTSSYSFRFNLSPELVPTFVEGTLEDRSFMRKIE